MKLIIKTEISFVINNIIKIVETNQNPQVNINEGFIELINSRNKLFPVNTS